MVNAGLLNVAVQVVDQPGGGPALGSVSPVKLEQMLEPPEAAERRREIWWEHSLS
jgi:hypothetical protein